MPSVPKKVPMRQCVGCRERRPKRELIRIVRAPDGAVILDCSGKANGRGAYLCRNTECLRKAVRSNALERVLDAKVSEDVLTRLGKELEEKHEG